MGEEVPLPVQRRMYGYILRVTGWIMRAVGVMAAVIGLYGVMPASTPTPPAVFLGLNRIESYPVFVPMALIGGVLLSCGLLIGRRARRHLVRIIESPASLLPGSYVLYLRPFILDRNTSGLELKTGRALFQSYNALSRSGRTYEERLARMFREFGPLVAVGRPEEQLPLGSGAQRIYIPRDGWEPIVSELIDSARLIILGAGPGKGTVWEYVEVMRRRDPSRLLILVTDRDAYRRFKASSIAEVEGVLLELQSRHGSSWQAPILPDLPSPARPRSPATYFFLAMLFFSPGWEPHLTFFDRSALQGSQREADHHFMKTLAPVIAHVRGGAGAPRSAL
jgi:hypothetical protein